MNPEMADLHARLLGAAHELDTMAREALAANDLNEMRRLRGKAAGVRLAIDYVYDKVQP